MVIVEQQNDQSGVQISAYTQKFQQQGLLTERLQTTLDLEQLLAIYCDAVRQKVALDSLSFATDELVLAVFGSIHHKPQHSAALYADGEYLGQLVYSKKIGFSSADLKQLNRFHQHLVFPLRNALRFAQVRRQALHDHMTGAGNRLLLDESIQHALSLKQRYHFDYVLLLLDLDGFKQVNDNHGHLTGDLILQHFTAVIKAQLRGYDRLFRYGGDEFIVLLQDADMKSAQHVFDRILAGLQADPLLHQHGIGCSAGAVFLQPELSSQALLKQADSALYKAKKSGKGRLCF